MKSFALVLPLLLLAACGDPVPTPPPGPKPDPAVPAGASGTGPVVRVIVVTGGETPVPDATVTIRLPRGAGPEGLAGITVRTDSEGVAILEVEKVLAPVADVPAFLTVTAAGFVPRQWALRSWGPRTGLGLIARLEPAAALAGRVADEAGRPVAGALAYLIRANLAGVAREDEVLGARTDADGAFRVDTAPAGVLDLGIRADGFVPLLRMDVALSPERETVLPPLVLARGGTIRGRVVTPEGDPVPGARVRAWQSRTAADFQLPGRGSAAAAGCVAETDAQGGFRLHGLAPGSYTVDAARHGYESVDAARSDLAPGAEEVVLVLRAGFTLRVLVVDDATGGPIRQFRLVSSEMEGDSDLQGRPLVRDERQVSGPTGSTELPLRRGAHYGVEVAAEGYDIGTAAVGPVGDDTPAALTIRLRPRK